ncbi:ATP-dependent helicase [Alteromonas sp. KUL49]|uniref:ATP-dependent helicase n=1 Tax=Alteromonas sp. KUL49 TaxID=2480798 RepID=UPI00102EDA19|nr:ATP-dependent helicase [Alteromonas sp. KUL49]TAP36862.1 ATP-dependent helicase [Alteromonas sp. KUL49]GEA13125.1 DNA helicase [Alteromonas sp. KUL49]
MSGLTPTEAIYDCLRNGENFVLQGGAGSGKTETLKRTLAYISQEYPKAKVACITHTNFAVQQIIDRVGEQYTISTIHSFLNQQIRDYKKNIQQVIDQLFCVKPIVRTKPEDHKDEKTFKKFEHEQYKKVYERYAKRLYQLKKETVPRVLGKREYDNDPETFNIDLNNLIGKLNKEIRLDIKQKDYSSIEYNETQFNSLSELTYGHDGLLEIACVLVREFSLLRKIFADKYDYIFIDEYQDTNPDIIKMFIEDISENGTVLGLFGDSMQAIYSDGVGNVNEYIDRKLVRKITKEDNFRCSEQVVRFANQIRYDGLEQEVAFKKKINEELEKIDDRQGKVELFFADSPIKPHKPNKPSKPRSNASAEKLEEYRGKLHDYELLLSEYENKIDQYHKDYAQKLDHLIEVAQREDVIEYTALKLTNKSIARDAGFPTLFEIFNNRYVDAKDEIEKKLSLWQFQNLFELCDAYQPFSAFEDVKPNYNEVIGRLKRNGFQLKTIQDKQLIKQHIRDILDSEEGALKTLEKAISLGLLKRSESSESFFVRAKMNLDFYRTNDLHESFKRIYRDGGNTFIRFNSHSELAEHDLFKEFSEEDFIEKERDLDSENFFERLLSDEISFKEILNYYCYLNEYLPFMTMHKTKGGEIENVLVVLDEYSWTKEYDFKNALSPDAELSKKEKNANLIYVACTRAKTNLRCVRLVNDKEEEDLFLSYFSDNAIKIS